MKNTRKWQIKIQRKLNKLNLDEDTVFFTLTLLVGIGAGALAVFLKKAIEFLTHFAKTNQAPTWDSYLLGALFVLISGFITMKYAPATSGSGLPELKIAIIVNHGKIKFRDWIAKLVTSILSLSSGLVVGREGPTIAITSGLGSSIGHLFSLSQSKIKSLVAVGAAGGIAAAFNTPIAAVTFTMEEVIGNLNARSLGPIVISAVAASVTAKILYGGDSLFAVLQYKFEDPMQLPYFFFVGVACAFVGPLWVKFLLAYRKFMKKYIAKYKLVIIFTTYSLIMGIAIITPKILGSGDDIVNQALLSNLLDWKIILFLLVAKFLLTGLCYSSGISGGIFMPTLFMGAMTGLLVGIGAHTISDSPIEVGAFALVGMGAYFAAVIKAPFTSILIIFEMTQDYKIVLPLMLANITAYIISSRFSKSSVYEQISEQNGIHLPTKEDHDIMDSLHVEDAMITKVQTINADLSIREALTYVNHSEVSGYPIIKNGLIFGVVSSNEIGQAYAKFQGDEPIGNIATKKIIGIYPDQSLMVAFHYLKKYRVSRLLVVSRINDKKLLGIITAEDIVNSFGFHIQEESKYGVIDKYLSEYEQKIKPE